MAEDMMNEEMTGMAAPATEEPAPAEEPTSKFDMETLMGNFMDMDDDSRKKQPLYWHLLRHLYLIRLLVSQLWHGLLNNWTNQLKVKESQNQKVME